MDWKQPLSGAYKAINLAGILLPLLGLVLAAVLLWNRMVGVTELAILAVGYLATGLGITVGFHRLFTHRSFETSRAVRYAFASSTTRAPVMRMRSLGVIAKTVFGVPAAAQTSSYCWRAASQYVGTVVACPMGGTPPIE